MPIKASSAKAKGRALQQHVVAAMLEKFPSLTELDVRSTSMGANGEDVQMSTAAKALFPYAVECKNQQGFGKLYQSYEQAVQNTKAGDTPLLVVKSNRKPVLAIVSFEHFMKGL